MTNKHLDPFRGGHHCQGCGVELIEHLGLFGTCKQLQKLKADHTALQRKHEDNRVSLLQYDSLRKHFHTMVSDVLGEDYYNMAMDVYDADRICCEDITTKANLTAWQKLFK